jgi:DNA-binding winged helix-turn-helix (wHTH) protein
MPRATFGPFVLDSDRRELTENARPVHLPHKSFMLLELLVREAPRAVPREELYDALWGETTVEDANLSNMISDLRAALHDSRSEPAYLKTVHGFGYAFVGEVALSDETRPAAARSDVAVLIWNGQELTLRVGDNVIGRHSDADVVIRSTGISRRHATLRLSLGGATIRDLGSKNGTFVGTASAAEEMPVRDGDELRLGSILLTFRLVGGDDTTRTVA